MKKYTTVCVLFLMLLIFSTITYAASEQLLRALGREFVGGAVEELGGETARQLVDQYKRLTKRPPTKSQTLDDLFEEVLRRTPKEELAVSCLLRAGWYCNLEQELPRSIDCSCEDTRTGKLYSGITD